MVSNESPVNISRNCGVIGEEDIESLRGRFLKEVVSLVPEKLDQHLDYYDSWSSGAVQIEGARLGRGVSLERPLQMDEGYLDGRHWTNFGV